MNEKLSDTLITESNTRTVPPLQTVLPHVKNWHRSAESIGMELYCRTFQVNFIKERTKILIWEQPEQPDLMVTRITRTGSSGVEVASFSLVSERSHLTAGTRKLLGRAEEKIRDMI